MKFDFTLFYGIFRKIVCRAQEWIFYCLFGCCFVVKPCRAMPCVPKAKDCSSDRRGQPSGMRKPSLACVLCLHVFVSFFLCFLVLSLALRSKVPNITFARDCSRRSFVPLRRRVSFISCHDNDVVTSVGRRMPDTEGRRCWDSNPGPYGSEPVP